MIELHADYNRDGRINAGSDYGARRGAGAIVAPNLDVDGRSLPADASVATSLVLDWARTSKSARDNELLALKIRLTTFPLPAGATAQLRLPNDLGDDVRLYDALRHRMTPRTSPTHMVYDLALAAAETSWFLELGSLAFSPKMTTATGSSLLGIDLFVTAAVVDSQQADLSTDQGNFRLTPLILVGDATGTAAERIYMAQVDDNVPSVRDVSSALRGMGVPLILISQAANNGDTWIQDQFQLGFTQSPVGLQRTVFHLPRMRTDSLSAPGTANLSTFVDGHFPSRELGVFQDFWTRTINVLDAQGQQQRVPLRQAEFMRFQMERAHRLKRWILEVLRRFNATAFDQERARIQTFFDLRINLSRLKGLADAALSSAEGRATTDDVRTARAAERSALQRVAREVESAVAVTPTTVTLTSPSISVELTQLFCNQFETSLEDKLSSLNYGGNIEVSPAVRGAPFGKVVVGSRSFRDFRNMDGDLVTFIEEQRSQPLVKINTAWLDVGHVDEVLTFVPSPSYGTAGSTLLRASPAIALDILRAARDLFLEGISWALRSSHIPSHGWYPRLMNRGSHPVTHMLRGKTWLHRYLDGPTAPEPIEPPRIYREMVEYWSYSLFDNMRYTPGPGADRFYPANLSAIEFLFFENVTNRCIEDVLLAERPRTPDVVSGGSTPPDTSDQEVAEAFDDCRVGEGFEPAERDEFRRFLDGVRLDDILRHEFPELPIVGVPVLFDRLDDWANESTIAFLPDLVNLQQSGRHVIVPRPYGPRMGMDDAISVLNTVMANLDASFRSNLNARALRRRHLDETWHWHHGGDSTSSRVTVNEIARAFQDGFESIEEAERRILRDRHNGSRFAGNYLQRGWQKVFIPENKVDLFEAYTQLVLEQLGLTVHWVDSWYYHLHSGGIHCATNCLRSVHYPARSAWWTQPEITPPSEFSAS